MTVSLLPTRLNDIVASATTVIGGDAIHECENNQSTPAELDDIMILGDSDKLIQIALNFLSHAVKYGEGAAIEIYFSKTGNNEITIVVEDFGSGIDNSLHDEIFQAYTRLANVEQRLTQGTGLGLCLVAELTKLQHGRTWLESKLGFGSRFYAAFPTLK